MLDGLDSGPASAWTHVFASSNFRSDISRARSRLIWSVQAFSAYGRWLDLAWLCDLLDLWLDWLWLAYLGVLEWTRLTWLALWGSLVSGLCDFLSRWCQTLPCGSARPGTSIFLFSHISSALEYPLRKIRYPAEWHVKVIRNGLRPELLSRCVVSIEAPFSSLFPLRLFKSTFPPPHSPSGRRCSDGCR